MSMKTMMLPISRVFPNIGQVKGLKKNPRFIRDDKYKKLVQSIKDDPEMLELRELIVYDTDDPSTGYVIIGGNMRYRAMKELGYKEVPCKILHHGFPVEKMRRITLKDNSGFGEWDFASLTSEWGMDDIELAAIDVPDIYMPLMTGEIQQPSQQLRQEQSEHAGQQPQYEQQPQQRLESKGEIDVSQFETKQTLKLDFTPNEYMYVLDKLREYGDDFPQSLLLILGYGGEDDDNEGLNF